MGSMGRSLGTEQEAKGERISLLREEMQRANIRACIIPTTDPHVGEYTPEHWKTRQWISGFTGSAGTLVVTGDKAGLWTDSRYFLQADDQLQGTGIELFKTGLPDTPTPEEWIKNELAAGDTVGLEGAVYAASDAVVENARFRRSRRGTDQYRPHGCSMASAGTDCGCRN
ncbi:hypothetical protein FACS189440_16400 [Bacteroidia bacterium]|nr:hypothetical protein FACS189440_16400 [Bacteroidia bacterium]